MQFHKMSEMAEEEKFMIDRQFQQSHDNLKASKYPKDVELTMYSDLTEGMRKANFYTDY